MSDPWGGASQPPYPGSAPVPPGAAPGPYPGVPSGPPAFGPPAYPGGGYDQPPGAGGWSGFAIAAFCCGLLIPVVGIFVAVPLGIIAIVKINKRRQRGLGLAISGMVLSVLWVVGLIGLGVYVVSQTAGRNQAGVIVEEGRIDYGEIRVGDCVDIPGGGEGDVDPNDMRGVPCDEGHSAEAVALIGVGGDSYPGQTTLDSASVERCATRVGGVIGADADYQAYRLIPDEKTWDDPNGHRVVCFVAAAGFGEMRQPLSEIFPGG